VLAWVRGRYIYIYIYIKSGQKDIQYKSMQFASKTGVFGMDRHCQEVATLLQPLKAHGFVIGAGGPFGREVYYAIVGVCLLRHIFRGTAVEGVGLGARCGHDGKEAENKDH